MTSVRRVHSSQRDIHPTLRRKVFVHCRSEWRRPIASHTHQVFHWLQRVKPSHAPIVFDSGCGKGESLRHIAVRHPGAFVVGIDKSAARVAACDGWLEKLPAAPACFVLKGIGAGKGRAAAEEARAVLVRAELADLWRLALRAGWKLAAHYLLYPNPWPKPEHLMRRWHGHPVFPTLIDLGGRIELRSNWSLYVEEFAAAVAYLNEVRGGGEVGRVRRYRPDSRSESASKDKKEIHWTAFERKYDLNGQELFQYVRDADSPGGPD